MGNNSSQMQKNNEALLKQLGEARANAASIAHWCRELLELLKERGDAAEEHCKATNEFLASSVKDACSIIHGYVMELYEQNQQQGRDQIRKFRKNLPDALRNILAECKYVREVASLAASAKNKCRRWDSSEMHAIIDAVCLRVIKTYNIFEKDLERAIKDKGIHTRVREVLGDIRQVITEMKNVLNDETNNAYVFRVNRLARMLGEALTQLEEDGKEQLLPARGLSMDPRPAKDEIRELAQLMADSIQHGWKVDVDVYADINRACHGHDYDNVVIRIRNAASGGSEHTESCLRCGLALA